MNLMLQIIFVYIGVNHVYTHIYIGTNMQQKFKYIIITTKPYITYIT